MNKKISRTLVIFYREYSTTIWSVVLIVVFAIAYWYMRVPRKTLADKVAEIIHSGIEADCDQFKDQNIGSQNYAVVCRNNIAQQKATSALNLSSCDKLDNNLMSISECKESIIRKQLANSQSLDTCRGLIGDLQQFCANEYWFSKATASHDVALCQHMDSQTTRGECIDTIYAGEMFTNSKLGCNQFTLAARREDCKTVQRLISQKKLKSDACFDIGDSLLRQTCIQRYPAVNLLNQ